MWAVKPKSSAWWPPPSMCVADITSLPTRHPSSGSTETSHLASPGSSHVTQISHDGRQFRHRVFPPQLPPWPPQRRWRWLEVRLPRPSESDAPRTGADLPKPEWQSLRTTLPLQFHQPAAVYQRPRSPHKWAVDTTFEWEFDFPMVTNHAFLPKSNNKKRANPNAASTLPRKTSKTATAQTAKPKASEKPKPVCPPKQNDPTRADQRIPHPNERP